MATVEEPPHSPATKRSRIYRRVRGARHFGLNRAALFRAQDHLLLCDYRTGFTERYKRYYFRDIEALIVRKTQQWIGLIVLWSALAVIFLMIGSYNGWNLFLKISLGVCAAFILRNVIRGPSCRTHVQTAVQTDLLPMLRRVRQTNRVLRSLVPSIEQAQAGTATNAAATPAAPGDAAPPPRAAAPSPSAGLNPFAATGTTALTGMSPVHIVTFALVLISGLLALWDAKYHSTTVFVVVVTVFVMATAGSVWALVRQGQIRVHRGAFIMTWLLVVSYLLGGFGVNYVYSMIYLTSDAARHSHAQFSFVSPLMMRGMEGFDYVLWVFAIGSVLMGLLGLVFSLMSGPARSEPPPVPPNEPA